jgi:hypothetical protein
MYALTSHILNDSHVYFKRHSAFLLFSFCGLEWSLFSLVNILIKNCPTQEEIWCHDFAVRQPTSPEHEAKLGRNAWYDKVV